MSIEKNEHGLWNVIDDEGKCVVAWNYTKEAAKAFDADIAWLRSLEAANPPEVRNA